MIEVFIRYYGAIHTIFPFSLLPQQIYSFSFFLTYFSHVYQWQGKNKYTNACHQTLNNVDKIPFEFQITETDLKEVVIEMNFYVLKLQLILLQWYLKWML